MGCCTTKYRQMRVASNVLQEETQELFNVFDADGNGVLNVEEVLQILEEAGVQASPIDIHYIFNAYDDDGDGVLSYNEFQSLFRQHLKTRAKKLINLFQRYNTDHDDSISYPELIQLLDSVGVSLDLLDAVLGGEIKKYFPTPDSKIDFKEFCMIFRQFV